MKKQIFSLCFFRFILRKFSGIPFRHMFVSNNSCFFWLKKFSIIERRKANTRFLVKGRVIYANLKKVILDI